MGSARATVRARRPHNQVPRTSRARMRYADFRDSIREALRRNPAGLTWAQLRDLLSLPYDRPCPTWTKQLEREIHLSRGRGAAGRALVWRIPRRARVG